MQLVVGRVGRPQGLRGEVTVEVRTDDPAQRFLAGASLDTVPPERGPLIVTAARWHSGRLLGRFAGHDDRDAPDALPDTVLPTPSRPLAPLAHPKHFYHPDLLYPPVL